MAYRICCLVMPPNRKSKLRAFLRVDQVLHRRKMAYIAILVSGLQSEWGVLTTTVLMSGFYIILFFFSNFFILPARLSFLLFKVTLLLFLSTNQDVRDEEEESCGRTHNASPSSPRSELRNFLCYSVFYRSP